MTAPTLSTCMLNRREKGRKEESVLEVRPSLTCYCMEEMPQPLQKRTNAEKDCVITDAGWRIGGMREEDCQDRWEQKVTTRIMIQTMDSNNMI